MPTVPWIPSCYSLPRFASQYLHVGTRLQSKMESILWNRLIANLNQYGQIIFSTHTQQKEFIQHGLNVPSLAISNGVDRHRYFPVNGKVENIEIRYQLPSRPRILFVGRLMKDKRIHLLIQAMERVCARRDAHLLGYVPESDLPALYRSADLFAIASVCEVQSIPALQALATGLPIVAVDAAALPELVKPGHNGFLLPTDDPSALGDAMLRVLQDPAYRA